MDHNTIAKCATVFKRLVLSLLSQPSPRSIIIEEYSAKVVNRHGAHLLVKDEQGIRHRCISPKKFSYVVCGDRVRCKYIDRDRDQLIEVSSRNNELLRQTEYATKLVAANIDSLVIVCAIEPAPSLELIDHYIVAAENLPASAMIVINKIDLCKSTETIAAIKNKYSNLPYPVIETSIEKPSSLEDLTRHLADHTCIFVGQSGVGKSTLINSLIPTLNIDTQTISDSIHQGKHTTSVTTLYDFPQGGELIDSPGVRNFSLPKLDKEKVSKGFCEIDKLSAQCKYHNCLHINEPSCAVKNAMGKNELHVERYASYKKMMEKFEK
ncbi:MAG: ribosome small subunit-dependent GTPase A [Gammaproteobacteria bacterium]|nr:ribosome small subunit-dependent GTPase A [Gammaproteobacteria bacterium]